MRSPQRNRNQSPRSASCKWRDETPPLVDDDLVGHAHLGVEEVTAVRGVSPALRDEGDTFGLMPTQLDLAARRGASGDARRAEEGFGGEVVAAARLVDEGQRDRLTGGEVDRLGREAEAGDVDSLRGGLRDSVISTASPRHSAS